MVKIWLVGFWLLSRESECLLLVVCCWFVLLLAACCLLLFAVCCLMFVVAGWSALFVSLLVAAVLLCVACCMTVVKCCPLVVLLLLEWQAAEVGRNFLDLFELKLPAFPFFSAVDPRFHCYHVFYSLDHKEFELTPRLHSKDCASQPWKYGFWNVGTR